jgi:hypothetical protein
MSQLDRQVSRRRTFAIISHPHAGKPTLTERLLLFGGAIQLEGAIKARGDARSVGLDEGRTGARHLGDGVGDGVRAGIPQRAAPGAGPLLTLGKPTAH